MSNYSKEDITSLKGLESVRLRPGMYLGSTNGDDCIQQIALELFSNIIDEHRAGYGDSADVYIDTKTNSILVRDKARGIPWGTKEDGSNVLIDTCTVLHTGGKFQEKGHSAYAGRSGGLNGVGLKCGVALSKEMYVITRRDGHEVKALFSQGIVKHYEEIKKGISQTGTEIMYIPDDSIFPNTKWNTARIAEQLEMLCYLTPGFTFNLIIDGKKEVFYSKNGLKDLLEKKVENKITNIYTASISDNGNDAEVALVFTKNSNQLEHYCFTNAIPQALGGTHLTGVKSSLTQNLNKLSMDKELIKDKLSGESWQRGLVVAINYGTSETPQFKNQTKDQLMNPSARGICSQATKEAILKISDKDLKEIAKKAETEKKAEEAAQRARKKVESLKKGQNKRNRMQLSEKLRDCRDRVNGELFLCEGDSAAGAAKQGSDSDFQAIFALKGKPLNILNCELDKALSNNEIYTIIDTMGCGIGEHFNINKLRYDKIILLTDSDSDGRHIDLLLLTMFTMYFPELIKQGKVYKAMAPLYRGKGAVKLEYFYDDKELSNFKGHLTNMEYFKGLGGLEPEDLKQTVFNPKTRKLIPLTINDIEEAKQHIENMMWEKSKEKLNYILKYSKGVI